METVVHNKQEGEIWKTDIKEPNYGHHIITVSFVFFYVFSKFAMFVVPANAPKWKWKNTLVSFLHALICSFGTMYCFYERPDMAEDLITIFTVTSHSLVSLSVGYFLYDLMDMLVNNLSRQSFEFAFHHVTVITCFTVTVWSRHYVGYSVVALLVEINSVFLHLRQLLQVAGLSKLNPWYRLNSLINLGTFIVFRIVLLAWMTRWIVINREAVPLVYYTLGSLGLAIMMVMNITLFWRLLRSDFISVKSKDAAINGKEKEASCKVE